jgi:hypothetical protein
MPARFTPALVALIAGLISSSPRAAAAETANPDVVKVAEKFFDCWASKNAACMENILTEDFVMVPRLARLLDKKTFISEFKAGRFGAISDGRELAKLPDFSVRMFGSAAIMTFSQSSPCCSATAQTPVPHYFTLVWVKSNGREWKLANYQASVNPNSLKEK